MLQELLSYTVIYLHGFQSSSRSQKAQALQQYLKVHTEFSSIACLSPDLPFSPELTLKRVEQVIMETERPVLMGSSMGGYYAAWASQEFACPAVLLNPVAYAETLFETFIGQGLENIYTGESYTFTQRDVDILKRISNSALKIPEKIYCFLETGDEVLDYRLAEKKYKLCQQKVITGGDHRFQSFEQRLPEMFNFFEHSLQTS